MAKDKHQRLTRNQSLVMDALSSANAPVSAYTILDELRDAGIRAPLQVYRAVEKLQEMGLVHRLESLNAFIACKHPDCKNQEAAIFMICNACGSASEVADKALTKRLDKLAGKYAFSSNTSTVELRGTCSDCR